MISYPSISPILFKLGPFELRWYSLAYLVGIFFGVFFLKSFLKSKEKLSTNELLDLASYLMAGILLGGRLGYILIYDFLYYVRHPIDILAVWNGGMSYHGGAIGAVIAVIIFCRLHQKNVWVILDFLGIGSTVGIGLGRISNFINGELYGRVSDVPWAMVFPYGGPQARHPSQLYEAFFEGACLFLILFLVRRLYTLKPGKLFALYIGLYGLFRFFLENFREPDPQLGLIYGCMSMGQLLCLLMMGIGIALWLYRSRSCPDPMTPSLKR